MKLTELLREGMSESRTIIDASQKYDGLKFNLLGAKDWYTVFELEYSVPNVDIQTHVKQTYAATRHSPEEWGGNEVQTEVIFYGKIRVGNRDSEDEIYYADFIGDMVTVETDDTARGLRFEYEGDTISELLNDLTTHMTSYAEKNVKDTHAEDYHDY